jgi:8-oxo-dGTP pyrophosphatase MutT (NUDIX family)
MGADTHDELLNVYDADGAVIGARPRHEAKGSGLAVGAVNAMVKDAAGRVLLQRRPADKENGGRWDKSVGGHVAAGEDFDQTVVREAGEELFDDAASPRVVLAETPAVFERTLRSADLASTVVLRRIGLQLNLRDVRSAPGGGGVRNVLYHVAVYEGRSEAAIESFRPQPSEIDALAWFTPAEVDRMLLEGALAPNMAFLWLAHGHRLVGRRAPGA